MCLQDSLHLQENSNFSRLEGRTLLLLTTISATRSLLVKLLEESSTPNSSATPRNSSLVNRPSTVANRLLLAIAKFLPAKLHEFNFVL